MVLSETSGLIQSTVTFDVTFFAMTNESRRFGQVAFPTSSWEKRKLFLQGLCFCALKAFRKTSGHLVLFSPTYPDLLITLRSKVPAMSIDREPKRGVIWGQR